MDADKILRRKKSFVITAYATVTNAKVGDLVKAPYPSKSTGGRIAPDCVGIITSKLGPCIDIKWDEGYTETYSLSTTNMYIVTIKETSVEEKPPVTQHLTERPVGGLTENKQDSSIRFEDMYLVGRFIYLKVNPEEGTWLQGLVKGQQYIVGGQTTYSFFLPANGCWIEKKYFGLTPEGAAITTKPMNDENFLKFENAIKSSKNERSTNDDRYKVPRPITKIGRKQESRGGAISGARSKARLG
jgi:hypothetical protein